MADTLAKRSRYADSIESSPALLDQLERAASETLSMRDELAVARTIFGETVRMLARATNANNGVMPQAVAQLALSQLREVNSVISNCAAIEAKRQDQALDAAKVILLIGRLKQDLCLSLKEAGISEAVPFIDAAFKRAQWTGALDTAAVKSALEAPASFDIKFRPIERDEQGKLLEHKQAFDTPEDALAGAKDLDLTPRSTKMANAKLDANPLQKVEDEALKAELEAANDLLDKDIEEAAASGAPLPGLSEARRSKLDKNTRKLLEGEK